MTEDTQGRVYPAERLVNFCASALTALGLPAEDAGVCATRMIDADLRGVDTHGIFRLNHYSQRIKAGGDQPAPEGPYHPGKCSDRPCGR